MRSVFFIIGIFCFTLLISCINQNGNEFLGMWKNKDPEGAGLKIIKEGNNFRVITIINGRESASEPFILRDNTLVYRVIDDGKPIGEMVLIISSGHLKMKGGIEWEKVSSQTD